VRLRFGSRSSMTFALGRLSSMASMSAALGACESRKVSRPEGLEIARLSEPSCQLRFPTGELATTQSLAKTSSSLQIVGKAAALRRPSPVLPSTVKQTAPGMGLEMRTWKFKLMTAHRVAILARLCGGAQQPRLLESPYGRQVTCLLEAPERDARKPQPCRPHERRDDEAAQPAEGCLARDVGRRVAQQEFLLAHCSKSVSHFIRHQDVGRRPHQPARPGKVVSESGCGARQTLVATKR
jgi:hypothetical protein